MSGRDDPSVEFLEVGDELVDPDGRSWTIASIYDEPTWGVRVSVTVERAGLPSEVLDAGDEVAFVDGRWRIRPNMALAHHQGGA